MESNDTTDDIGEHIREVRQLTTVASLNYDCWFTLRGPERDAHSDTLRKYSDYWTTAINAHFVGMIVPLYALYEPKTSTWNVPGLLAALRNGEHMGEAALNELDAMHADALPVWKQKVSVLRNRVFGHRSRAHSTEELFRQIQARPKDFADLIRAAKDILEKVCLCTGRPTHVYAISGRGDLLRMLEEIAPVTSDMPFRGSTQRYFSIRKTKLG